MSDIQKIKINGTEYTLCDGGAVAFDMAQALSDAEKAQVRDNIGANTLIVTVTDQTADRTPQQIYAHVQSGGTAVLLYDEIFFGMTRATASHAEFSSATDENLIDYIKVNEDGSVERMEHGFVFTGDLAETVKTVNGVAPDESGNVEVETGGGIWDSICVALLNTILLSVPTDGDQTANINALNRQLLANISGDDAADNESGGDAAEPVLMELLITTTQDTYNIGTSFGDITYNVTAVYSDGSTQAVSDYAISDGTVASGDNTVTITALGITATVVVRGEILPVVSLYNQDMSTAAFDSGVNVFAQNQDVTVKLDIYQATAMLNQYIANMAGASATSKSFGLYARSGNMATNFMGYAANAGYPSVDDARFLFVFTYKSAESTAYMYFGRIVGSAELEKKVVTHNVTDLPPYPDCDNFALKQNAYTCNALEVTYEYMTEEQAYAWMEREV